jgi:hypothetical protein
MEQIIIILASLISFTFLFLLAILVINDSIDSGLPGSKKEFVTKIKNIFVSIKSKIDYRKLFFDFINGWYDLLKWLVMVGIITLAAENSQDKILLLLMNATYVIFFLFLTGNLIKIFFNFYYIISPQFQENFLKNFRTYWTWFNRFDHANSTAKKAFLKEFINDPILKNLPIDFFRFSLKFMLLVIIIPLMLSVIVLVCMMWYIGAIHDTVLKLN